MAGVIHGVNYVGVEIVESELRISEHLTRIVYEESDEGSSLARIIGSVNDADFVFLIASLDECLEVLLEKFCRVARERLVKIIFVSPEPVAKTDKRDILVLNRNGEFKDYEAAFPRVALGIVNYLYGMAIVSKDSMLPIGSNLAGNMNFDALTDYLLHGVIDKLIYFTTRKPFIRYKRTDVDVIWQMATRNGTGIGYGPDKGVLAAQAAISSLNQQGVRNCDIQGILLHISGAPDMTAADIENVNRYISSLAPIDTQIECGVVVQEDLGDDVMVVTIMAAEMLLRDITAMRLRSPDSWVTMCDEDLRCIPAFERKKWFMECNSDLGRPI
ncbi:MAG: hypothetical protein P4L79_00065 [Legionella sp.]|uniref:hypothetical protein n=1 Tax=Legionella sp. TaxID=459 RepID=UPI0028484A0D|nr:hypothetical protein [Legionella sp.]